MTLKTPFSGGSGTLVQWPHLLPLAKTLVWLALAIVLLVGAWFVYWRGWPLLLIGLLGIFLILSYTPWLNRSPWLCWLAPGLAFGPLMIWGAQIALIGEITTNAILMSWVLFFLVNNLLLLNQLPDVNADRNAGRRHFAIVYGAQHSHRLYLAGLILAWLPIEWGLIANDWPWFSALVVIGFLAGLWIHHQVRHYFDHPKKLLPALGLNVAVTLLIPFLLSIVLASDG